MYTHQYFFISTVSVPGFICFIQFHGLTLCSVFLGGIWMIRFSLPGYHRYYFFVLSSTAARHRTAQQVQKAAGTKTARTRSRLRQKLPWKRQTKAAFCLCVRVCVSTTTWNHKKLGPTPPPSPSPHPLPPPPHPPPQVFPNSSRTEQSHMSNSFDSQKPHSLKSVPITQEHNSHMSNRLDSQQKKPQPKDCRVKFNSTDSKYSERATTHFCH